ncbi:MAG TPA: ATP-binding protein, partial [Roseiflexaceae bacterium]|nr:ATP-binding protein [Roseiflexaceae bacterium]
SSNPTQRLLMAAAETATDEPLRFTREDANHAGLRRLLRDEGIRAVCVAPLARENDSGRLVLCWRDQAVADTVSIGDVAAMARAGGLALHNARQYVSAIEERTFLAALVEQSSDALVVADWQTLAIVAVNQAAEQLFGEGRATLQTMQLEQVLVPEVGDWNSLRLANAHDEQIAILKRGDGQVRAVGLIASEVHTQEAYFLLLTVRDLSERWQAIQRLVQTEKLGGMRRLTSSIAHHINNPMQAIATSLRLLQQPLDATRRDRYLQLAHEEIERLIGLVRRTLAVYQPVQESMRAVSIHAVLQSALEQVSAQLDAQGIALEFELDAGMPRVMGFASHLREVFQNLAMNALEAMPNGGRLVVRTMTQRDGQGDPQIVIEFGDTGTGISAERLETIFEPYNSSHPNRAGLGLAISYSIVENHAGQLAVCSSHTGTTFSVTLPMLEETSLL